MNRRVRWTSSIKCQIIVMYIIEYTCDFNAHNISTLIAKWISFHYIPNPRIPPLNDSQFARIIKSFIPHTSSLSFFNVTLSDDVSYNFNNTQPFQHVAFHQCRYKGFDITPLLLQFLRITERLIFDVTTFNSNCFSTFLPDRL